MKKLAFQSKKEDFFSILAFQLFNKECIHCELSI